MEKRTNDMGMKSYGEYRSGMGMKSYRDFTKEELAKMPPCPYVKRWGEEYCHEDEFIVWLIGHEEWAYAYDWD